MTTFAVSFGCLVSGYLFGRWQQGGSNAAVGWVVELAALLFNFVVVAGFVALILWGLSSHGSG